MVLGPVGDEGCAYDTAYIEGAPDVRVARIAAVVSQHEDVPGGNCIGAVVVVGRLVYIRLGELYAVHIYPAAATFTIRIRGADGIGIGLDFYRLTFDGDYALDEIARLGGSLKYDDIASLWAVEEIAEVGGRAGVEHTREEVGVIAVIEAAVD